MAGKRKIASRHKNKVDLVKKRKPSLREAPVHPPAPQIPSGYFGGSTVKIEACSVWKKLKEEDGRRPENDQCCEDHPESASVKIVDIQLTRDFATLKVKVTASHPCGIMKVTAFLAEVKVENMPVPGGGLVPVETITPILFGEDFLEDSEVFNCIETVKPTLRIPVTKAFGTPFYVAVIAQDCCGKDAGAHSSRRLIA